MRWFFATLFFTACPSPQMVASSEALTGYWRPHDGEDTVFAFAPAVEAEELFNLSGNMVAPQTSAVSAVYLRDALTQLASYEATATELRQTVLADVMNPPGAKFSTRIYEFERGAKLVLGSKKEGVTQRTWDGFDFCPRSMATGWAAIPTTGCPNVLTTGGSMAFDQQGRLFAYTGSGLAPGTACPPAPGFLEVPRGCGSAVFSAPNGRTSTTRVHSDGTLRIAYLTLENELRVRERPAGAKDFTETTVQTGARQSALMLVDQSGPLLVTGNVSAAMDPLAFRKQGEAWVPFALKRRSAAQPVGAVSHVAVDGMNRLWLVASGQLLRERETDFEELPTPLGGVDGLHVDPELSPHLLVRTSRGLEYTVLRGTTWERHLVDGNANGLIATHGARPYRVVTTAPSVRNPSNEVLSFTQPALITVRDDGRLEGELAGGPQNFLSGVSTTFVAVGPRGEIAATLTGEQVMWRSPKGRLYPQPKKLDLVIEGPPIRVFSDDGRFSCETSCTVDANLGDRIAFRVEPRPGVVALLPHCDRPTKTAEAPCWFSVVDAQNASTAPRNPFFKVITRPTPLKSAFSAANSQGLATSFSLDGDQVALSVLFTGNATEYVVDGVQVPVTGVFESRGLVLVNRSTKASVFAALPRDVTVYALKPDGRGGFWAALYVSNQVVRFGPQSVGAAQTNVLARVHFTSDGSVDSNVTVLSTPRNMPVGLIGASIAADGSLAAVVSGSTPLSVLSLTETNALVQVAADGTRAAYGFMQPPASSGQVVAADGRRIGFVLGTTMGVTAFVWNGARLDRLEVPGAAFRALDVSPDAMLLGLSSAADLSVAGRVLVGQRHAVRLDATLGFVGAHSLPTASTAAWSWAVGLVPEGAGFIVDGQLQWLSPSMAPLRPALAVPSTMMRVSGVGTLPTQVSGGSWWVLARPDADFGVTGATAIAELGVF